MQSLHQALATLARVRIGRAAVAALAATAPDALRTLRATVLAEIPAFSDSHNPDILPGLETHAQEHAHEILRLMGGDGAGDFEFVRAHARLRAEQRFALEATLHAYRCGQRVFSHWLREAATGPAHGTRKAEQRVSALADFTIEYTHAISTIATAEYVAHTRLLAGAEGDLRTELLATLLDGYDESDARVARLLRRAGYLEQRQSYCLVVAQSVIAREMEQPARARRIIEAVSAELSSLPIRLLAGVRNSLVTAVLSAARRQSGWTAAQMTLIERLEPRLRMLGPAVLVGISAEHPSTSFLPRALREATLALDFASVDKRVMAYSALPVRSLLVHYGADQVRAMPPPWASVLLEADARSQGMLVQTLRAVADADINVQKAARALGRHPNTVYARIERIRELTGRDGQRYADLTELLLAADCWRR